MSRSQNKKSSRPRKVRPFIFCDSSRNAQNRINSPDRNEGTKLKIEYVKNVYIYTNLHSWLIFHQMIDSAQNIKVRCKGTKSWCPC